ncbi:unnamed protein product [Microthlaspi erraticum]|nr:unnamed protein product [Microthlaspi erraticum]
MPSERRFPSGIMTLEYTKAVQETVYEHIRVVREGHLRIIFSQEPKILLWEFCTRLVAPQVYAGEPIDSGFSKRYVRCLQKVDPISKFIHNSGISNPNKLDQLYVTTTTIRQQGYEKDCKNQIQDQRKKSKRNLQQRL